jgi:hypothetical protein
LALYLAPVLVTFVLVARLAFPSLAAADSPPGPDAIASGLPDAGLASVSSPQAGPPLAENSEQAAQTPLEGAAPQVASAVARASAGLPLDAEGVTSAVARSMPQPFSTGSSHGPSLDRVDSLAATLTVWTALSVFGWLVFLTASQTPPPSWSSQPFIPPRR